MADKTTALMVYCTCPDSDSAMALARAAVGARLAACVNRLDAVTSVFYWDDALAEDTECLLIAKTDTEHYPALETLWSGLHPYELPEIIAVPIACGSKAYLQWISTSLSD